MKKLGLCAALILLLLPTHRAQAQTSLAPCVTNTSTILGVPTGTSCQPVTSSNQLPVAVYGGSSATSGFCFTSNGPGAVATFQACGGGGGSSLAVTATSANRSFYPLFATATGGSVSTVYVDTASPLAYNPSTGNFGIGVLAPGYKLQVVGATGQYFGTTGANNEVMTVDNAGGGNQDVLIFDDAGTAKWEFGKQTDNSWFQYDNVNAKNFFLVSTTGDITLGETTTSAVAVVGNFSTGGNSTLAGTTTANNLTVTGTCTGCGPSSRLSSLLGATTTNTIDNSNWAQAWTWNTLSTQTALSLTSTNVTSGKIIDVEATNTAGTGYAGYFSNTATSASAYALYANGKMALASTSTTAFTAGANGATNPGLRVNTIASSAATGLEIKSQVQGTGVVLNTLDPNPTSSTNFLVNMPNGSIVLGTNFLYGGNLFSINYSSFLFNPIPASFTASPNFLVNIAADTNLTASVEVPAVSFSINAHGGRQHNAGALTLQRDFLITGANDSFVSASTLTDGATLGVIYKGCGTNATCTNESAIYVPTMALVTTGAVTNSYGVNITAATGATNNYAAKFSGQTLFNGHINFTGSPPVVSACGTSPSIDANATDTSGTITVGTVAATSCTITFANAYASYAHCRITSETAGLAAVAYSYTTSAITITGTSLIGGIFDYNCDGK